MRKEFLGIHNYYLYKDSGLLFNNINISKNINLSGLRFSSSEDQMTIRLRGNMSFEEKLEQIRAITGNDPRVVLDRQTLDALASGKDVAIHIEKNTERRNLLIGLGSLAAMLIGGIAGASYNKELANAVDDRIKGDVDFIKRNPHWDMNPFGGATATRYNITATTIDEPNNPSRTEPSKNFDQLIIENINRIQREMAVKLGIRADINPFERAKNYGGRFNERSHLNTSVYTLSQEDMQDPAVVAYLKSKGRTLKVGSQLSVEDAFQINMIKTFGLNVLQSMSTGLKDGDGYVAGFSDELLRMNDKDLLERINAIRSLNGLGNIKPEEFQLLKTYLNRFFRSNMQMADTAGLFDNVTQNTLSQLRDKNGNKINVTMEQFNEILQKLRNNPASLTNQELYILANVAEIGLKDGGYNRRLGNIDDGFWGAQHMTNMQAAISDRMQMMGDSAIVLNKFARGEALNDQEKELLLKIYNMANPNAKISDLSQATITGINNTFDFIQNQIQRIVDAVSKTEKGMFGRFNTVLQENLKRATGIIDQIGNAQAVFNLNASGNIIDVNDDLRNFSTVVSGMINPKGLTNEQIQKAIETYNAANPNAQIKDLSQMTEEGINNVYSSVSASSSSSSIAQSAASITSQLEGNITVSQATKDNLTKNFTEALANQLRANLINGFTNQEIQVVAIALAKSNGDIEKAKSILGNNTSAISLLDNIFNRNNPALINNFQAVGNLFNRLNEVQTEKVNLRIISSNMEKAEAMIGRLKGKEGEYNLATAKSLFDGINQIENQLKEAYDVSDISQLPQDVRDRFNKLKADANSVIRRIEEANNGTQVVRSNISSVNQAKQSGYNTGQTDGTNNTSNAGQTDGTNNTSNAGQTDGTNNTSNTGQTDGTNNTSNAGQTDGTNNTSNTGQTDGTNNTSNTGQTDGTNNTSNAGQTDGTNNTSNTGQTDGTNNTSNTGQTDGTNSQSSFNKDDKSLVEKILNDILENQDLSDVEKLEKVQELGRIYRNGSIFAKAALEELLEKGNDMIKQEASDQLNGSGKFLESMDAISQGFTKLSAFFDEIAILFFAIADKIMKKAFQEAQFDYGFSGQNNGSIASRYKDGANSPITDIYVNMKKMYNDSYAAWISMAQYEAILAGDEKKVHKLSENIKIAEENFKEMLRNLYEGNSQEINEQLKDAANKGNRLAKFAMGLPSLSFQKLGLKVDSIEQAISEAGRNLRTNDYKATARLANALNRGADPNNRDPDAMFYADNLNAYFASRNSQDNNNYIQSLQEVAVSRNSNFNQKNRAIRQIRDEAITGRLERAEESLRSLEEIINDSNATQEVKDRALEALADIALKGNLRIAQQSLEILKNNAMSSTASKQTKDKSMSLIVDVALSDRQISKNATELLKSNTIDDDLKLKAIYYAQAKDKEKSVDLIGNKK